MKEGIHHFPVKPCKHQHIPHKHATSSAASAATNKTYRPVMELGFFARLSVFNAYTSILCDTILLLLLFSQLLLLLYRRRDQNGPLVGFSASPFPLFNSLQPIRSQAKEEKGAGEQRDNTPLNYSSLCSISPYLYRPALSQLRPFRSSSCGCFSSYRLFQPFSLRHQHCRPSYTSNPIQLNSGIEFVTSQVTSAHCLWYKKREQGA